jgi:cobalamin-dependent methionine synthase I
VIHVLDASQNPIIASKFTNKDSRDEFVTQLYSDYEALRQSFAAKKEVLVPLREAREKHIPIDWKSYEPFVPNQKGVHVLPYIPVEEIVDHGKEICFPSGMDEMGPVTKKLRDTLTGIQMGHIDGPDGWVHEIKCD